MNHPFTLLLSVLLLGEQAFGLLHTAAKLLPPNADHAAVSLQLAVLCGLWLLLLWGVCALWRYRNAGRYGYVLPLSLRDAGGLAVLLAYALAALPNWMFALLHPHTLSFRQPRYVLAAVCQIALLAACLHVLWRQWRLMRRLRRQTAPHTIRLPDDFRN